MSEFVVQDADDLLTLFNQGCQARSLNTSDVNVSRQKSSAVFSVNIYQKSAKQPMGVKGRLQIVDLAGVECGVSKDSSFCQGLSTLLTMINKRAEDKKDSTLYNSSKLTRLLQVTQ